MNATANQAATAMQDENWLKPCMSQNEAAMYREYVGRAKMVLEFGIGGSTGIAAEVPGVKLIGIDSHPDWIARCKLDPRVAVLEREKRLDLKLVDIGTVGDWGMPTDPTSLRKWPTYSMGIWNQLNGRQPDFVFVDGRFRLSCALQTVLNLPQANYLVMHDFWSRDFYHPILEFVEVIDRVDELGVFRPKPDADLRKLAKVACRTLIDPR
ncbi:MAG: hypothetical protein R3D85_03995 [Paracoccaceae bacterium]